MKILWIVDDFSGGAGNVAQLLSRALSERGHAVTMLLTNKKTSPKYDMGEVYMEVFNFNRSHNEAFLRWLKHLTKALRTYIIENHFDVVVSFLDVINTVTALALMRTNIPILVCERSNPLETFPRFPWNYLRYPAYARANRVSVQFNIFTNMCHGLFKKKMIVFPNPIITPDVHRPDNVCRDTFKLISVARLEPVKQFPLMIDIFEEIHKRRPKTELIILGDGTQRELLSELIHRKGLDDCIHLPGSTKDVHTVMAEHDAYLMTSQQEGFPNALCEAMAVGLPCVAFECHSGLRDLIFDGKTGYLVAPGDSDAMIAQVEQLIDNYTLCSTIGKQAQLLTETYSLDKIVDMWESTLEELIRNKDDFT